MIFNKCCIEFHIFIRWDEWVPEERVVKHSDANLVRQKQLKDTYSNKKKKPVKISHKISAEDQSRSSDISESPQKHQGK
jgi:mortality factor 4-like protein 1